MNPKKKFIIYFSIVTFCLIGIIGASFAYWLFVREQTGTNRLTTGCLDLSITNDTKEISLTNTFPISNEDGMKLNPYIFTITNTCDLFLSYQITLNTLPTTTMDNKYLNVVLDRNVIQTFDQYEELPTLNGYQETRLLQTGSLAENDSKTFSLRIWMDGENNGNDLEAMNKTFQARIAVTITPSSYSPVDQGFRTLADAMLVNEYQSSSVEQAKDAIRAKQSPDFTKTAPIIIWNQRISNTLSTITSNTSSYIGTGYNFNTETGMYTLENYGGTDHYQNYTDIRNEEYNQNTYFTCGGSVTYNQEGVPNYWRPTSCNTLYKISSVEAYEEENETKYRLQVYAYSQDENESDISDRGLYVANDENGESYYYRGSVENNYVKFADSYWRIIRLNGDGSVRLLYAGDSPNATGAEQNIGLSAFHQQNDKPQYVGYMYGNSTDTYENSVKNENDSTMKSVLDNWYQEHILTPGLQDYISDSVFCNDRSIYSGDGISTTVTTSYNANIRMNNHTPTFTCSNQNDKFTVSDTIGNGALTYPIGLITVDELHYAGMLDNVLNRSSYVFSSQVYWTMSPIFFLKTEARSRMWRITTSGTLNSDTTDTAYGVRPVINLKHDTVISSGVGTRNDPFVIS
ncbi:MAG: hypothetical protein HFH86_00160 [Bacilli bacterium]|jgi:hypothetical protein|nr:hypothetical protein [Bacilli bacterium]